MGAVLGAFAVLPGLAVGSFLNVVAARLPERDAAALALTLKRRGVGAHRGRIGRRAGRREDVEAEGPGRQPAQRREVRADAVDRFVAGREEAEAPGLGDRGGERRGGGAARERRLHDRTLELIQQRHDAGPVSPNRGIAAGAPI